MSYYIALDIGGTQLRAALFQQHNNTPNLIKRIPTQGDGILPLERLFSLIESVWPENQTIAAIGAAVAAPLDPKSGIVYVAPNIPGWIDMPLKRYLEDRFRVRTALGNDANLAALGEWKYGAGKGHHNLVYLTISTGIGGGVIVNNHLLLGEHGLAAELGHVTVWPNGPICSCGCRGHLEAIASGTGIAHWVERKLVKGSPSILKSCPIITAKEVANAALQGDALAKQAFNRAGKFLGRTIADYLHIFNPTVVILGGGVSRSGRLLLDPVRRTIRHSVMSPFFLENLTITTAALGDDAGLLGALTLAQNLADA